MTQYVFGSGILFGRQLTDAAGNAIAANIQPVTRFGALNDVTLDIGFDTKTLHGQNQFPLAVGRGKGKITGKAKFAQLNGAMINNLFFGQTLAAGLTADVYETTGKLIPATPFTITGGATETGVLFKIPNTGTFKADLGVLDANGLAMTKVASAPATGQYSVNETTGAYVFAAADTGLRVYINYQYTATVAGAQKSTIVNLPMGYAPTFSVSLSAPYQGKQLTIDLPQCVASKLSFATKLDDFMMPDFSWESFADSAGNVMTYSLSE
jgi:hypothetical protein